MSEPPRTNSPEIEHEADAPESFRAAWGIPVIIYILTFLAFLPALSNGFVSIDDHELLIQTTGWRGLASENIAWMLRSTVLGHWQPLTWLTYAIDYTLAGNRLEPAIFHFTNVALHAANAVLLYTVFLRVLGMTGTAATVIRRCAAAAGVMLWSAHPLRVESVAWVTERRDVLSAFFLLLALLAYLRAFPPGSAGPASRLAYAASIALLALSLLSKAWGMTFFVIVTIIDWYPLRRLPHNPLRWLGRAPIAILLQKAPYFLLAIGAAAAAMHAIPSIGARVTFAEWPLSSRAVQAAYGLVWYPSKTLWPTALGPLYELRRGLNPFDAEYLLRYAILAFVAVGLILAWRRLPGIVAAAGIYLVCISPVLGFAQAGDQFVADRYSYLSTMPFFALIAVGLARLGERCGGRLRVPVPLMVAPIILVLGIATWRQTEVWRDSETLWRHAWQTGPDRIMARLAHGTALQELGRIDEAIAQYREAARRKPDQGLAWYALGNALRDTDDFDGAVQAYREAAKHMIQPYMPLVNLGSLLLRQGREDEAIEAFRAAVRDVENPRPGAHPSGVPYLALGAALANRGGRGDVEGAREAFHKALAYPSCVEQARRHLARLEGNP